MIDAFRRLQRLSLIGRCLIFPSLSDEQNASKQGLLRLSVRLLHVPTGRASTLYSSLHDSDRGGLASMYTDFPPTPLEVLWSKMRLPSASPFPWVSCRTYAHFTAAEGAALTIEDSQTSPSPPAWMKQSCFGFSSSWHVELSPDDQGLHMQPAEHRELSDLQLVYRALQALPWTD